jgi:glycerol-3-phosphate acyltransferase PlsX
MGSDRCPVPDVEGAVQAARALLPGPDRIILVGDQVAIERELARHQAARLPLEIVHASQAVVMNDTPSQVRTQKPDSSMLVGLNLVKVGKADAFVSAGHTGAILALATLHTLGRIRGVRRPALSAVIRFGDIRVVLVDLGANADCRPEWLVQFGVMGSLYAERAMSVQNPRVAVLSNGEEEGKGNQLVRDAALLIAQSGLNYVGNLEPKEMLGGQADVMVADGFVGNVALKTLEALSGLIFEELRRVFTANPLRVLGAALVAPGLRRLRHQIDPFEGGGAPLLGVNGVVIIAHGRSNAKGIRNAIQRAREAVQGGLIDAIRERIAQHAGMEGAENG